MRAFLQRVQKAAVSVDEKIVGQCSQGWFILLGITHEDTEKEADFIAKKVASIRAFNDPDGKMNLNIKSIQGSILVISQFTLYADLSRGNRPGFSKSASPDHANTLYEYFVKKLREEDIPVETGIFGANMQIDSHCDGPVSLMIESHLSP